MQETNDSTTFEKIGIKSYETMLAVTQSQQSLKQMLSICLGHYNLSMMQWLVIGVLIDRSQKPIDIAKRIGVSPPYVTLILNQINELGYITKTVIEDDERSKIVVISPQGKALALKVEKKLMSCIEREMGGLPAEDLSNFFQVSDYIAKNVRHR
jgi:DNA-binding MarR family transcriptional regulator